MNKIKSALRASSHDLTPPKRTLRNEEGAIDLSSIMVGIIVIGLIGGVIAATIFAVIPWAQDNAAKQQLDSLTSAESAYMGLSSAVPMALPVGSTANTFGSSAQLASASLMNTGAGYCAVTSADGKSYVTYSQSASGNVFSATDQNSSPVLTGTVSDSCGFILSSVAHSNAVTATYVDPNPTKTILTYKCDSTITGTIPLNSNLIGTETWNDGVTNTYNGTTPAVSRTLTAGVTYTMTFDGTYDNMMGAKDSSTANLTGCLVSLDHWGLNTKVKSAALAFASATKLTSVPAYLPSTVTSIQGMFMSASNFNDINVSKWDTSHVTRMQDIFDSASSFNQPLNSWNTTNATVMSDMFHRAGAFNQDLSKWDTSNVTNMNEMFDSAAAFNSPVGNWNTSKVTTMYNMFSGATSFNQDLSKWDTSSVTSMVSMFEGASSFNQPLNSWKTSNVTDTYRMFLASAFNQPLNSWDVSHATRIGLMFYLDTSFNQNISGWNTATLDPANGTNFVPASFPNAYMPANTSK